MNNTTKSVLILGLIGFAMTVLAIVCSIFGLTDIAAGLMAGG